MLDVDQGIFHDGHRFDAQSLNLSAGNSDWGLDCYRLRGGLSDGVDVLRLDNGRLQLEILPTRGMGIWRGRLGDLELKWDSPVRRPVHPSWVDEMRRGGIGWLDAFNELICRCGLGWHGAPGNDVQTDDDGNVLSDQFLPLHGRIANLAAHHVRIDVAADGAISLTGVVDEVSVFGGRLQLSSTLTTYPGSSEFEINDTVTNLGSAPAETEMLYHCNFGRPLLESGATLHTACTRLAPRDVRAAADVDQWSNYRDAETGYAEQVYFMEPIPDDDGCSQVVLSNASQSAAVSLKFHTSTLPWFVQWKNTQADADGYCTGLEPCSSFPNPRMCERSRQRVRLLQPEESVTYQLQFTIAIEPGDVKRMVEQVDQLQARSARNIAAQPLDAWSPPAD